MADRHGRAGAAACPGADADRRQPGGVRSRCRLDPGTRRGPDRVGPRPSHDRGRSRVTLGSDQEGHGGNRPVQGTASAGSQPTAHGSLSSAVHRMASASALAQIVGQLVSFVQTVILARLLTPTDVGIFTAGTVLTVLLTDVA